MSDFESIVLSEDDPRLGQRDSEGAILSWPTLDIEGRRYDPLNATTLAVAQDRFVVVGPDRGHRLGPIEIRGVESADISDAERPE